jgi:RimJ/RimL family protein N-acetyltransferase
MTGVGTSTHDTGELLDEARFVAILAAKLDVPTDALVAGQRFVEDLGFDSLRLIELALALRELGLVLPTDLLPQIEDAQDAYHWYRTRWEQGALVDMPGESPAGPPPLRGQLVRLRPLFQTDYEALYRIALDERVGYRWRHRGTTPSPEAFVRGLWERVLVQFVIERVEDAAVLGLVSAYDVHPAGFAYLAVLTRADAVGTGWAWEAVSLLVGYVFANWPLRRLYAEALEFNYATFASGAGTYFEELGRLREHEFALGRYWDMVILGLDRERWTSLASRLQGYLPAVEPR